MQSAGPGSSSPPSLACGFRLTVEALGNARANESVEVHPQISEAVLAIRFATPERDAASAILIALPGGGPHSRLFTVLRAQKGLSYDAGAAQRAFSGGAVMLLGATVKNRNVPAAA
jgi:predicted Zn-dependent peptidase